MTIAEQVKVLDMLKEGKACVAIERYLGVNEATIRTIKKAEDSSVN